MGWAQYPTPPLKAGAGGASRPREVAQDPDPVHQAELGLILEADDEAALEERFGQTLEFGTAGLRGELGAGSNRMNRVTVMRAAAGLGNRLLADQSEDRPSVFAVM